MRVAVTGATGFVGRHVVAELARRECDVVLATRDPVRQAQFTGMRVVQLDIDAPGADALERLGYPDVLIHLAWGGLPNYRAAEHFEVELPRQYRFLKALVRDGLKSLLVTGTCAEYGMQSGPLAEHLPTAPVSAYGHAKDALRHQLSLLQESSAFALTWARLFFMHGDGQPSSSLLPQLEAAVRRGDATFNMSGGEQLRDYLPVTEVARHIVALALSGNGHGVVNVCDGKPTSVRRLVEDQLTAHGWNIRLNLGHYPYIDYEPMAFWGDRQRLDSILGRR